MKNLQKISADINYLKDQGFKKVWLNDPTFNTDIRHCRQVIEVIGSAGLSWACTMRSDETLLNNNFLSDMRKAGCKRIFLGIESASQTILDRNSKGTKIEVVKQCLASAKDAKMPVEGFIVLGLPGENIKTLEETEKLCKEKSFIPRPHYAVPFPGTKLFNDFLAEQSETDEGKLTEQILEKMATLQYDGTDVPSKMPIVEVPTHIIRATMYRLLECCVEAEEGERGRWARLIA